MKRTIKTIILSLFVICICFTLCSCAALDEARLNHAFYKDDDTSTITFRNKSYKALPNCEDFSPEWENLAYVTEKDVPVLVRSMFGDILYFSDDLKFLNVYGVKYCAEDLYEKYREKFTNYSLDFYCMEYSYYDKTGYCSTTILLSEDQIKAINNAIKNSQQSNQQIPSYEYDYVDIFACDETMEFKRYLGQLIKYYDKFYISDGNTYKMIATEDEMYFSATFYKD